ncbi:MAG: AraC family transcriptional regulator [Mesorhizobium sp.]|nr:AraC family transcriptional regulator [Mesorhizobium sp.]
MTKRNAETMAVLSLSASDFDPDIRVAAFQDAVASMCRLDITPRDSTTFQSETTIGLLPGLMTGQTMHSTCSAVRTHALAAETGDNVMIHVPMSGGFSMYQQGGNNVICKPGSVYLDPNEMPGMAEFHGDRNDVFYLSIPRAFLATAGTSLNGALREIVPITPQWRLLLRYAQSLHEELALLPPEEIATCSSHVHDLTLMAMGASREAEEIAKGRGVRAARLKAIKADIESHLVSPLLTSDWIARRHAISPRYVRSLFAAEETSFREYVALRRLLLVHRRLCDPAQCALGISEIALSSGFSDLSWFNASFRRAFGATPKDVRAVALAAAFSAD